MSDEQGSSPRSTISRTTIELRYFYSLCIIRTVNGLVDPSQKGFFAESIYNIASRIGLPGWIVEIRHDATHDRLPSLSLLRSGARELLSWLYNNYWVPQQVYIAELSAVCVAEDSQPLTTEETTKRCDSSITFLTSILLPVIIESSVLTDKVVDMTREAEHRLLVWQPMIEEFHRLFPHTFIHQLTQRMMIKTLDMISGNLSSDEVYKKILFGVTVVRHWLEHQVINYVHKKRSLSAVEESYASISHRINRTISMLRIYNHSNVYEIVSEISRLRDLLQERFNFTPTEADDDIHDLKRKKSSHFESVRMEYFPIWPLGLLPGYVHANELLMVEEKYD